mmetsp:Transcript_87031/g.269451  ORF Transcript_87031/g.269451 Transcript_87031/m.269451 type:complete len:236 (+) Transcript_87031:632-1339(+)
MLDAPPTPLHRTVLSLRRARALQTACARGRNLLLCAGWHAAGDQRGERRDGADFDLRLDVGPEVAQALGELEGMPPREAKVAHVAVLDLEKCLHIVEAVAEEDLCVLLEAAVPEKDDHGMVVVGLRGHTMEVLKALLQSCRVMGRDAKLLQVVVPNLPECLQIVEAMPQQHIRMMQEAAVPEKGHPLLALLQVQALPGGSRWAPLEVPALVGRGGRPGSPRGQEGVAEPRGRAGD